MYVWLVGGLSRNTENIDYIRCFQSWVDLWCEATCLSGVERKWEPTNWHSKYIVRVLGIYLQLLESIKLLKICMSNAVRAAYYL